MLSFLLQAVGISLSGVMAPGPATAATVLAGLRRRHAGLLIAVGHGIIEMPLMVLAMCGVTLLKSPWVQASVALLGGACLLMMGGLMLAGMNKPNQQANPGSQRHPVWIGVIVTAGNPYFLLWWVTIGLALCTQAAQIGVWAFALFAVLHWICDAIWLEMLSLASHAGSKLLGGRSGKYVLAVCGGALILFGCKFIVSGLGAIPL